MVAVVRRVSFLLACSGLVLAPAIALPALAQLRATPVVGGLNRPVGFVQHPTEATVQLVIEQGGRVRVVQAGQLQNPDFLDLTGRIAAGGEQGLLGLAFAPDFRTSGRVFASFTNQSGDSVIARFTRLGGDPLRLDPASEFDLRWPGGNRFIAQPFTNHNGGHIAFGADGLLYIGLGDGGSGDDPLNNAQNPLSLLGKMLRLNVAVPASDPEGYDVPATNPFVGRAGVLPEIWSLGLRNPWRWSVDDPAHGGTGAIVIGDVGQGAWEEVDYEPAGAGGRDYGWRNREGAHNNVTSLAPFVTPLRDPIWEYGRLVGASIIGGFVYRGTGLGSSYVGRYFFADFVSSRVWSVALVVSASTGEATAQNVIEHTAELASAAASPSSFGVDANGELYLVSYNGSVSRIDGAGPSSGRTRTGPVVGTARPRF
ncbi:MAG: PQQ-dependent sugar dehydrogenase [Acidobacteriota bacterium]